MVKMSVIKRMRELYFSTEETAKLQDMVILYDAVKAVILFGEEISPSNVTLPQILKELRDVLDHLMRVVAAKIGTKAAPTEGYVKINLDKAFSHVYRSAYDALDWISIILRMEISVELDGYSTSAIEASMPAYYTTIKPRLDIAIPEKIARIRGMKDIGVPEPKSIAEYADLVEELKGYRETVIGAKPSLIDYSKRERRTKLKQYLIGALVGAAITGLGVALRMVLT